MTTQLEIAKMVLNEVGTRSTITSITDGSMEANILNLYYAPVRDHALRAARWNFAKHTDTLTLFKALPGTPEATSTATGTGWSRKYPAPPWLYSYIPPSNYLYARSVIPQPDISNISPPLYPVASGNISLPRVIRVPFEIAIDHYDISGNPLSSDQRVILTNAPSPLLEYTFNSSEEALWDSSFIMVMVKALAAYAAIALTSDKQLSQMKLAEANNIIMQARASDANEGLTVLDHIPDWLRIRGVGDYPEFNFYYPYGPLFSTSF
jgi:hypothetical protein